MGIYSIDGVVPVVATDAFVHPDAVLIGDVVIGSGAYVGPCASLRGDFGRVTVGDGANIQDCCVAHSFPGAECTIEPEGHIGHGAVLHGCTIATGAMVGMNAVIMDGATIGARSLVAANSFVPAGFSVPDACLAAGNPAKVVRELDEAMLEWKANGARVYQALAQRSLRTMERATPLTSLGERRAVLSVDSRTSIPLHEFRKRRNGT